MSHASAALSRQPARHPAAAREKPRRARRWPLVAGSVVGLMGLGLAAYLHLTARSLDQVVHIQLGGVSLQIPAALIRPGPQRDGGELSRLDLALDSTDFGAAKPRPASADAASGLDRVFLVALTRPDTIGDPAARLNELHGRFLEPDLANGPAGLMLRRFRAASPYAGEELLFAPPDGRLFWARCPTPIEAPRGALAPVCLTELRRDGLDLQLRFDPSQLERWAEMEAGLTALLAEWRR